MSFQKLYRLTCDVPNCGAVAADVGAGASEAAEAAETLGWVRHEIDDQRFDCCPLHATLSLRDLVERRRVERLKRASGRLA